jgi:putative phosphotransacetylase
MNKKIPVEVSARHIHLSQKDLEALFGLGYQLKKARQLTQPSDFASEETLDIRAGEKIIPSLRVIGPVREKTQIEVSLTDMIFLNVKPIIRLSGDLKGTPGIALIGPKGKVELKEGLIVVQRHIHCSANEAKKIGLKKRAVSVLIKGEREITFHNVAIRIGDNYKLCLHLDTDEGNAAGINKIGEGYLIF